MDDEQFEVEYENAELRFYDMKAYKRNFAGARKKGINTNTVFIVPNKCYGMTLKGKAAVHKYGLTKSTMLDTIYFHANRENCMLADEVGAQLWEVHEQYKRRIV